MTFCRGQDVVYIGDQRTGLWLRIFMFFHPEPGDDLIEGNVYRIDNITEFGQIELIGIKSPGDKYWCEGFMPACFRPAVARKTDIAVFTKMLKKRPAPTPAELWEIHHSGAMQ